MANPFDEFDPSPAKSAGGNAFDQFDAVNPIEPAKPAAKPTLSRSWGEVAKDTGVGVVQGAANLLGGTAELANLATGGLLDKGVRAAQGGLTSLVNGGAYRPGPGIGGAFDDANTDLDKKKSPTLRRKQQELADTEGFIGSAKKVLTDPALAGQFLAEQVPNLALLAGGAAPTLARGVAAAEARGLAGTAAQEAGKRTLQRQIVASEAIQEAGPAAQQARQQAEALPDEVWTSNPEFVQRVQAGEDPDAVKQSMVLWAQGKAAGIGGAAGALGGKLTAPLESRLFTREALDQGGDGLLKTVGKTALKEAAEEAVQEGGAQVGSNVGVQGIDPTVGTFEGVPEAAGTGAALGGLLGGGMAGAGRLAQREPTLQRTQPDPTPDPGTPGTPPEVLQLEHNPDPIEVGPDGTATTPAQAATLRRAQADAGLTPDVQAAQTQHPAYVPNPGAPLGSLADVVNTLTPLSAGNDKPILEGTATRVEPQADRRPQIEAALAQVAGGVIDARTVSNIAARLGVPTQQVADIRREMRAAERAKGSLHDAAAGPAADGAGNAPGLSLDGGVDPGLGPVVPDHAPGSLGEAAATAAAHAIPEPAAPAPTGLTPAAHTSTTPSAAEAAAAPDALAPSAAPATSARETAPAGQPAAEAPTESTLESPDASVAAASPQTGEGDITQPGGAIAAAAAEAALSPENDRPEPTEAQKEAGNYKKGHAKIGTLDISIENPAGTSRRPEWPPLANHYGYIKRTVGKDKDHVDVFMGEHAEDVNRPVFVVDQYDPKTGHFDEHKVILGATTAEEARGMYRANYAADWTGDGAVTAMSHDEFEAWVRDPNKTMQPASVDEFAKVTPRPDASPPAQPTAGDKVAATAGNDQPTSEKDYPTVRVGSIPKRNGGGFVVDVYAKNGSTVSGEGATREEARADAIKRARLLEEPASAASETAQSETPETPETFGAPIAAEIRPAGKKAERGFSKAESLTAEIEKRGLDPKDYDVVRTRENGYIGKRKADPDAGKDTSRAGVAAGFLRITDKDGTPRIVSEADWNGDGDTLPVYGLDGAKAMIKRKGKKVPEQITVPREGARAFDRKAIKGGTAPEHIGVEAELLGATDRDIQKMGAAFDEYRKSAEVRAQTYAFDDPKPSEVVDLGKKAGIREEKGSGKTVYHRDAGWMTPAEARAHIKEWKARAAAQGQDNAIMRANSQRVVLSLFDLTGEWSQPWRDAGYQVYQFDIQDDWTFEHEDPETGEITERKAGDINNLDYDFFVEMFGMFEGNDVFAILAANPCTDFTVSGAKHFAAKDADGRTIASHRLVQRTLDLIEFFKPAVWAMENPTGRIGRLNGMPPSRLVFDPYQMGDNYTKETRLWGRFNADLPIAPVSPNEADGGQGSKMHKKHGGKSIKTKNARSETPEGFAYGFFLANNAHDHPVQALAWQFDHVSRELIQEAHDAGLTPDEIKGAIEDGNYYDQSYADAEASLREAIAEKKDGDGQQDEFDAEMRSYEAKAGKGPRVIANEVSLDGRTQAERDAGKPPLITLTEARNALIEVRSQIEEQGRVVDARLTARERQLKQVIAELETADSAGPLTKAEWDALTSHASGGRARALEMAGIRKLAPAVDFRYLGTEELAKLAGPVRQILAETSARPKGPHAATIERLQQVLDRLPPEGNRIDDATARAQIGSVIESLRDNDPDMEGTLEVLASASSHLLRQRPPLAEVLDEIHEHLSATDKPALLEELKTTLDGLAERAFAAGDGKLSGQISSFVLGMKADDRNLSREWVDDVIDTRRKLVERLEKKARPVTVKPAGKGATAIVIDPSAVSANTVFTEDAAAKARALLKAKLSGSQTNAGLDPEILQAGITLAGYHIEKGARTFAAYAKAMVADLGDVVRPYLKSWYMGVKFDPRAAGFDGMDGSAAVEAFDLNALESADERPSDTPESAQTAAEETPDADLATDRNAGEPAPVSGRGGRSRGRAQSAGRDDRQPLDAGLAAADEGAAGSGDLFGGPAAAGGRGARRAGERADDAPGAARADGSERAESGAADVSGDFDLAGEDIGSGGLATKYRDNVAAIRIVKALAAENRPSTPEERKALARYAGWGALKGVFDPANKQWAKQHAELKSLLTDAEYKAARASTRNAHFTSKGVVSAMVAGLQRLGFTRGRLLEPSVGVGNFFGLLPAKLRSSASLYGVELDPITAKIAAGLYPSAKVRNEGFEAFQVPGGYFDAAIGNPPFGEEPIRDSENSPYSGFSIHNYFLAKAIDKLRPGGVAMFVVSHNFLDAKDARARDWIAQRADLVAAVRLPRTAFKGNAGTEVVTDIVVFQRRSESAERNGIGDTAWTKTQPKAVTDPKTGETHKHGVNAYFHAHPEAILGTESAAGSMYRAGEYTVEPNGELDTQLAAWAETLPAGIHAPINRTEAMQATEVPEGVKVGSYFVDKAGQIQRRGDDVAGERTATAWVAPNAKAAERLAGMIGVRDALRQQMRLERDPEAAESAIEANRKVLNQRYDAFLKAYGHLNSQTNRRLFVDDTDAPLLQMLEFDFDRGVSKEAAKKDGTEERKPSATKADIFQRRVFFIQNEQQPVSSAKDAMVASLNYRGAVDLAYMAGIYHGKDEAAIEAELGDLVYRTPEGALVTADEYLSGDVKTKLAEAEFAAKADPAFARHVEALKKVIPADKTPSEIHVSLGAGFVPAPVMGDFIEHITGQSTAAAYVTALGRWLFNPTGKIDPVRNSQTWGTKDVGADEIIAHTINGKAIVVTKTVRYADGKTQTFVLEAETEAAREKQNAVRAEWKSWLWRDAERADTVLREYNEKMNRTVPRTYDGSHLTLPGKGPAIDLLKHQLDGIWRGIQSRQILLDHVVGAGKTFQIVGMIMEMRRLGIARKPLLVVPNHLTLQWRSEFARLYPGANVLAATPDDFSKDMRPKLFSKMVTGDWDAIIIGHSQLKKLGLPPETEARILQEQIDELAESIELIKRERGDRNIVRDMEGIKKTLEAKAKERLTKVGDRDKVLTFDELGVDALGVDELHEFKNLAYTSTMTKVPGMGNPKGSARGFDLFVKTQWLFETFGEQAPLITATGTPVSNSLVEMFNMQRYMQYPRLKREGLHLFDSWARAYGSVENVYEVSPSGSGFRASSRFAKFQNLSSLMGHYLAFADVVTLDDIKRTQEAAGKPFPVPKIAGGKPTLVLAKRSPQVASFMGVPTLAKAEDGSAKFRYDPATGSHKIEEKDGKFIATFTNAGGNQHAGTHETAADAELAIVEAALTPVVELDPKSVLGRFANLRQLTKESKGKVNALSLTGEANKAGLDYRLINPAAPDFPGSKINLAVGNIVATWKQWTKEKGTQLVFCDMSVPLSAKSAFAAKPKPAYVRDGEGELIRKPATLHARDGAEEIPYLIVTERAKSGDTAGEFAVYDAATGHRMRGPFPSRGDARTWAEQSLATLDTREAWLQARERSPEIEQDAIDEYNDANEIDTDKSPGITLQDVAGVSSKFSVYDDMREKLIAQGIPANQIAFIHDYDTPDAKAKLFAAVNRGDIRVLFGSTPKMGAGTNVQQKAVALHHIDAPWRPSDLEQREGRVIRQGNLIGFDKNGNNIRPDFAVSIFRYATEQTYDARRWQVLEHKARGIEQLRNYDGTLNEIEDIDGEASNSADMKAAASGDPLILRETQLRNDVKRLEHLEVAHADNVVAARRQAAAAQKEADEYGPRRLRLLTQLVADVQPAEKDGVPKGSKVDGKAYAERKEFTQAVARAVGGFAKDVAERNNPQGFTIAWRGLEFTVEESRLGGYVDVSSATESLLYLNPKSEEFSASGLITRMNNYADRLPALVAQAEAGIKQAQSQAERFTEAAAKPFAEAEDLVTARKEFRQVQRLLLLKGPELTASDKPLLSEGLERQRAALRTAGLGDTLDELMASKGGDLGPKFSRPDPVLEFDGFEDYADEFDLLENNGSGDSSASIEAINRRRDDMAAGNVRALIDRDGSVRPLLGVDAVDTHARAGQIIVQRGIGRDPWTILSHGNDVSLDLARGRINRARGELDSLGEDGEPLFSRPAGKARGVDPAKLSALVTSIRQQLADTGLTVTALATADQLPARAKTGEGWQTAEGYYDDNGHVYLVAANLRSLDRAQSVFAHEAVGHFGVEAITGAAEWAQIADTIRGMRANPKHAALFAEIGRRYVGVNEPLFVREAVAVMAEKGIRNTVTERVVAAVRRFLRSLGLDLKFSEAELRQLIVRAARYVKHGTRPRVNPTISAQSPKTVGGFSQPAGTFYSALAEAVARGTGAPKKGNAQAWAGWLDGAQRRGEFRASERSWLGVDAWLAEQGSVTREQLAAFIRANQVQVQDVVLDDASGAPKISDALNLWLEDDYNDGPETAEEWRNAAEMLDEYGDDEHRAMAAEARAIADRVEGGAVIDGRTKFASYQLPGGANYRELLLTLPAKAPTNPVAFEFPTQQAAEDYLVDVSAAGFEEWDYSVDPTDPRVVRWASNPPFRALQLVTENRGRTIEGETVDNNVFASSHFDQPNILAHVRFNERTDADGQRVLFLEEIQSDWHQAGRKRGYKTGELTEEESLRRQRDIFARFDAGTITREERNEELSRLSDDRQGLRGVPDAPFKATDEWALLAFKRMVRWAAEHGFDRIAWTTGEQQAERYDLSKQVDGIRYAKDAQDRYALRVYRKGGSRWEAFAPGGERLTADRLADYVGKELADKIVRGEGNRVGAWNHLDGVDLKIGGEGMKAFYDAILPSAVNKWGKRFGAKVGTTKVDTTVTVGDNEYMEANASGGWRARYGRESGWFETEQEARDWLASHKVAPAHALDLTPAMRETALAGQPLFSRPDPQATVDAIDATATAGGSARVLAQAKEALAGLKPHNLKENTRPTWLGALTLRHLAELGKDLKLNHVSRYADRVQKMTTDRNVMQDEAAAVAEPWEKFQRKDRKGADATANLMHDATIEGVDPAGEYRALRTGVTQRGPDEDVTPESIRKRLDMIESDLAKAGSPTAKDRLEAEAGNWKALLAREQARQRSYPALVRRWLDLPQAGRDVYIAARDAYLRQSDKLEAAIIERIMATGADGRTRQQVIATLRHQFESARIEGPYFPLARFGEFWISATDKDGAPFFSLYETVQEWEQARKDLAAQGMTGLKAGRKIAEARSAAGVGSGFMADLEALLEEQGVADKVRDDVWQLFLRTLPELSMRKHSIHRKKTAGYSQDALRAFAGNMFHGSFQIARVKHTHELEADLLSLKQAVDGLAESDPDRAAKAGALTTEVSLRHEWVMNPKDSKAVSYVTSLGFAWYLGATPAAALVNLTQTAIVTFPVLASRFGVAKAGQALTSGMKRALRNIDGKLERGLTAEELQAFKVWRDSGALTHTSAHNLAGLSETDTQSFNPVARRAMTVISWLFHHTEMVNREATALAAFRLAREAGDDFAKATAYAEAVITESHFDYTNANRARFMQSNAAKVLLLFRQYSLNMTWMLWRNAYLSLKGESPEVQKAARVKLAGILGMTGLFAGAMGLPLMSVMFGLANAAAAAFGDDDDEPFDAEVAFRNFLADLLGPQLARVVAEGPVGQVTGVDIASRVSLNNLWLRDPDRELEGQAKADWLLEQAAGPVAGGMLVNTLRGMQMIEDGHTWRGLETMLPKAVKDAMKAVRYATQGANTLRGDPIIEDLSVGGSLLQLAGFSPGSLRERYDANNAAKNYEKALLDRRSALLDAFAMAWRNEDPESLGRTRDKILEWNAAHPELGITMATIRRSLESRMRYSTRAEGGVVLDARVAEAAKQQARFAE